MSEKIQIKLTKDSDCKATNWENKKEVEGVGILQTAFLCTAMLRRRALILQQIYIKKIRRLASLHE